MHNNPDDAWYHGIDQANRDYHNAGGGKQGLPAYKRGMDNALTDYNIAKAKESGSGAGSSWSSGASNAGTSATGAGAGLLLVVVLILGLMGGLVSAINPSPDHFTPPSSPFPPQPSDSRAIAAWTYAKQHATRYMASARFVPVAGQSTDETSGYSGGGCIDFATIMSGYGACAQDASGNNRGVQQFTGAFARFDVPTAPPTVDDRILAPVVAIGGGGASIEGGMVSFRDGLTPLYKWMWDDFPAPASYCQAQCPRLQPGDEVFVSVYNLDGGRTSFVWENLTTGEYYYAYEPTPMRDSNEAAVLLGTPEPPSTFWKFGKVSFRDATGYSGDANGTVTGLLLDAYAVDRANAGSPLGECVGPISGGAFDVRGDKTCG